MTAVRAALLLAAASLGWTWLDPHARAREGNRLYDAGKFDEAATAYNEALVDEPDSAPLHGSLGAARYKDGKYDEALRALEQVAADEKDPVRTARTAYNLGNVKYRLGQAVETSDPQKAIGLWADALLAYRRALGAMPEDQDAKLNHELVAKKLADLRKKLEEQQKQQDKQQQDQKEGSDQQDQQKQQAGEQPQEQPQAKPEPKPKPDAPRSAEQRAKEQQEQGGSRGGGQAERRDGQMSPEEAAALVDSQRDQEVRPDEVVKRLEGGVVAEPAEDW